MTTHTDSLKWHSADETPPQEGDYILFNQCDGYHLVEAWFGEANVFEGFYRFGSVYKFPREAYCAWALLPDTVTTMFQRFVEESA